ncbi:hypothetical protein CCAX7_58510 [Capsulimonas corticalis]|uniref:Uncharacterized protein n=1 Tax=Capsulimonas corticalis TaxID=2219043 RepID=A0A402D030_9BACT|nr:hypothetical protein [Capsulimonas corticalis]BDI33800.1 hypothetical protein CCAX7_58510 [Capsulimonas corticalis]
MPPYDPLGNFVAEPPAPLPPRVWPPPPTSETPPPEEINTSGEDGDIPDEVAALKWSWGAFFFPFLWSINHRLIFLGLLGLVLGSLYWFFHVYGGVIFLTYAACLAIKGNELAWRRRRFEGGLAQFFEVQRVWMRCGFLVWALAISFTCLMLFVAARQRAYNRQYYQQYYQNGGHAVELRHSQKTFLTF